LTRGLSNADLEEMARVNVSLTIVLNVRANPLYAMLQRAKGSQLQQTSDLSIALAFLSERLIKSVRERVMLQQFAGLLMNNGTT
jgi:hypothetical protein